VLFTEEAKPSKVNFSCYVASPTAVLVPARNVGVSQQITLLEHDSPDLAAALQLAELQSSLDEEIAVDAAKPETEPTSRDYQILVNCQDKADRDRLLRRLRKDGRICQALSRPS